LIPPERDAPLPHLSRTAGQVELGTRQWDGLGRLKEEHAGSLRIRHDYIPGQMSSDTKTMPDGSTLKMLYDLRLREVLLSSTLTDAASGAASTLTSATYDNALSLPTEIVAEGGKMTITPDYLGRMTRQSIVLNNDVERHYEVVITPGGLILDKTGIDGVSQRYDYDGYGRLLSVRDRDLEIDLGYDALSRLEQRTARSVVNGAADGRSVVQRMTYDALGRLSEQIWEHIDPAGTQKRRLVLSWRSDDKIVGRAWYADDEATPRREETMDYDNRGRLIVHGIVAVDGEHPLDEMEQPYLRQAFVHDCLDNLLTVTTTRVDAQENVTTYTYDPLDVDRLVGVSNSLTGYPGYGTPLTLVYDGNGNLIDDGQGRTLHWDGAGRLSTVTLAQTDVRQYIHGPDGRVSTVTRAGQPTFRYREDGAIAFEVDPQEGRRFIRAQGGIVAETRLTGAIRETILLGTDPQGSVVTESAPERTS
jgi:YD repeat-containing protein